MTRRARVLFDIHPRTVGGTEQFLARLLPRLDRSRFEAIAVSSHAGPPLRALTALGIQTATVPAFFSQQGVFRLAELITKTGVALVQSNYYSSQLALAARAALTHHQPPFARSLPERRPQTHTYLADGHSDGGCDIPRRPVLRVHNLLS